MNRPIPFNDLIPLPATSIPPQDRAAALDAVRADIGDCTRCPLAYAGRRNIVFADGDPNARLMFVGEGPGADEDAPGPPLRRQIRPAAQQHDRRHGPAPRRRLHRQHRQVPPARQPRPRARRSEYLHAVPARQIDIVQPEVIVALGATAAMYLLGVKQSLASLRGRWHSVRGAQARRHLSPRLPPTRPPPERRSLERPAAASWPPWA